MLLSFGSFSPLVTVFWFLSQHTFITPSDNIMNTLLSGRSDEIYEMVDVAPFSLPVSSLPLCPFLSVSSAAPGDDSSPFLVGLGDRCSLIHPEEVGQSAEFIFALIYSIFLLFLFLWLFFSSSLHYLRPSYSDYFSLVCISQFLDPELKSLRDHQ